MSTSERKKIFLTFDMDWINDDAFTYMYEILCKYGVKATIHITNETELLQQLRKDPNMELGIHPNFNPLLQGNTDKDFKGIIRNILEVVPEAVTVRSHGLVTSSTISAEYADQGLKYETNLYIEPQDGMHLLPFRDGHDLCRVPFIYEDDIYLNQSQKHDMRWYLEDHFEALRIFNFHPIHVFLNTEDLERYEAAKKYTKDYVNLKAYQNNSQKGVKDYLIELITIAKELDYEFVTIKDGI